ncbi:MAG: acyl-CoA-binding protein [Flavipsychrobacter sp.]|nr:acyl-CoA-binding protein [Flavipsychrobacter sp.]
MNLAEQFEEATKNSKLLTSRPDNDTLLKLYSLYKQATEGDNDEPVPSNPFDFVARAKYDAWSGLSGIKKEDAMQQYIDLVASLQNK